MTRRKKLGAVLLGAILTLGVGAGLASAPLETAAAQTYTITYGSKGSDSSNIASGVIPSERVNVTNDGPSLLTVTFARNDTTKFFIFSNNFKSIILFSGFGNGGQLNFVLNEGHFTSIAFNTGMSNGGIKVNGGETFDTINGSFSQQIDNLSEITIQNVAEGAEASQEKRTLLETFTLTYEVLTPYESAVDTFVTNFMRPEILASDLGTGKCISEGYYADAKAAFNDLLDPQRRLFLSNEAYVAPRARLMAWAAANGDVLNTSTNMLENSSSPEQSPFLNGLNDNSTIVIVVIISFVIISVLGGAFYLRKREQF